MQDRSGGRLLSAQGLESLQKEAPKGRFFHLEA